MEQKNESPNTPAGISQRSVEIAVTLIFLLIGSVVAIDSYRIGAGWSSDGPQAGYFPFYIGLIMCVSSLVTLAQALSGKSSRSDTIFVEWSQLKDRKSVV